MPIPSLEKKVDRILARICAGMSVVLFGACSVSPTQMTQTYRTVEIQLSAPDNQRYYLVDARGYGYAQTTGTSGTLTFAVPPNAPVQECYTVLTGQRRNLLKGQVWFTPSLRSTFVSLAARRDSARKQLNESQQTQRDAQGRIDQARDALVSNRAWQNGTCSLPSPQAIPPKPSARCDSREGCVQFAGALCYGHFLGAQGCGMAASRLNMPEIASSPLCGALISKALSEEYGLDDLVVDLAHGFIDQKAKEIGQHDPLTGALITGGNMVWELMEAQACTDRIADREFAPVDQWMRQADTISAEPRQLYQACTRNEVTIEAQSKSLGELSAKSASLVNQIAQLDTQLRQLASQREPLKFCQAR